MDTSKLYKLKFNLLLKSIQSDMIKKFIRKILYVINLHFLNICSSQISYEKCGFLLYVLMWTMRMDSRHMVSFVNLSTVKASTPCKRPVHNYWHVRSVPSFHQPPDKNFNVPLSLSCACICQECARRRDSTPAWVMWRRERKGRDAGVRQRNPRISRPF